MISVAIIIGSSRPGRKAKAVGEWVNSVAVKRSDAEFTLIDLEEINLPFLDEPEPPAKGHYTQQHTKDWAEKINRFDAFIFVTPEYNHSVPAVLKNALDYLYKEWNNKAAGFVSYGSAGGVRAMEHLRAITGELQLAAVRNQVALTFTNDFENERLKPSEKQEKTLTKLIDQLLIWAEALKKVRNNK